MTGGSVEDVPQGAPPSRKPPRATPASLVCIVHKSPPAGLPELRVGSAQAEDELHGRHRRRAAGQVLEQVAGGQGEGVVAVGAPHADAQRRRRGIVCEAAEGGRGKQSRGDVGAVVAFSWPNAVALEMSRKSTLHACQPTQPPTAPGAQLGHCVQALHCAVHVAGVAQVLQPSAILAHACGRQRGQQA